MRPDLTVFELSGTDLFINITASTCGYPTVTSQMAAYYPVLIAGYLKTDTIVVLSAVNMAEFGTG